MTGNGTYQLLPNSPKWESGWDGRYQTVYLPVTILGTGKISWSIWPTEKAGRAAGRDSQIFACQLARSKSAESAALCPSDMMLCVISYWVLSGAKRRQIQQLRCCVLPAKLLKRRDVYLKLTRHNGRAGAHGTYNPKHNDRSFNLANSEHIDPERAKGNIYWDCFHGFRSALAPQDPDNLAATFSDDVFYLRTVQRLFCTISVEIAWSVWYTKINPYMRFSQKGASKCLKSARIARAVF